MARNGIDGHITREQADEYAVGSLEPEMERLITLHAADCARCREILFESEDVAATIAMSAPRHQAPPRLKNKVAVEAGITRPGPMQYFVRFGQAAAIFAAVLVSVAALTGMVSMRGQVQDLREQNAGLQSEVRDLSSQEVQILDLNMRVSEAEQRAAEFEESAERDRELLAAMMNPESETAEVVTMEHGEGAQGRLIWEEDEGRLWFVAHKLPELPGDQAYQLWVEDGGDYIPLGTLRPDDSGTATFVRNLANGLSGYAQAIVTVESREAGHAYERRGDSVFLVPSLPRSRE